MTGFTVKSERLVLPLLGFLAMMGCAAPAWGWGCKGHEIIALMAEKRLSVSARTQVTQILAGAPIRPELRRFCQETGLDAFADSSTWADDVRSVRPETAGWHFIDIPLSTTNADISRFCPPATSCVTQAIADQLAVLRDANRSAQDRGDALRFVIHLVGDLHQPLHAATNNDLGGNCVPLAFFGQNPQENNGQTEAYRPNLHSIWDVDIIERWAQGRTPQELASELDRNSPQQRSLPGKSEKIDFPLWAREGHQMAREMVYGNLPVRVPIEAPEPVASCADHNHVSTRMLNLHETIGDRYQAAAAAAIQERLRTAAVRLANVLDTLWP